MGVDRNGCVCIWRMNVKMCQCHVRPMPVLSHPIWDPAWCWKDSHCSLDCFVFYPPLVSREERSPSSPEKSWAWGDVQVTFLCVHVKSINFSRTVWPWRLTRMPGSPGGTQRSTEVSGHGDFMFPWPSFSYLLPSVSRTVISPFSLSLVLMRKDAGLHKNLET